MFRRFWSSDASVGALVALAAILCIIAFAAIAVRADDAGAPAERDVYYLAVFSSQTTPKIPPRTHNWGVAVHVRTDGATRNVVESQTISWMPRSAEIRLLNLRVVPGANWSHEQSVSHAARTGQRTSFWGAYEITADAYQRFQQQRERLIAGRYGYQCLDTIGEADRRRNGVNCVHALADFADLLPHRPGVVQPYGDESAAMIVRALVRRALIVDPQTDATWLADEMGWSGDDIVQRKLQFPPPAPTEIATSD